MPPEHTRGLHQPMRTRSLAMQDTGLYGLLGSDTLSPIYDHLPPDVVVHRAHGEKKNILYSPSHYHRRSFTYKWYDSWEEYQAYQGREDIRHLLPVFSYKGNYYSAITTKGNEFSNIHAQVTSLNQGFRVYGLQDGLDLQRVIRASQVMQANGIETEAVLRIRSLPSFFIKEDRKMKEVPEDELKTYLISKIRKEVEKTYSQENISFIEDTYQATFEERLNEVLKPMHFFVTDRAHQVAERLVDFTVPTDTKEYREMFQGIFDYVNQTNVLKQQDGKLAVIPHIWDAEADEDIEAYLTNELPTRMAKNIGRMHKIGLAHGFLTFHNVSAVGSIVDLDSVKGKALGITIEDPATKTEKIEDIAEKDTRADLLTIYLDFTDVLNNLQNKKLSSLSSGYVERAQWTFLQTYAQERYGIALPQKITANVQNVTQTLSQLFPELEDLFSPLLTGLISHEHNFSYSYNVGVATHFAPFLETEREYYKEKLPELIQQEGKKQALYSLTDEIYYEPMQHRFYAFIEKQIRQDLLAKSRKFQQDVLQEISPDALDTIIKLFISRELLKIHIQLDNSEEKRHLLWKSAEKILQEAMKEVSF